jgi:hypothetical protein
VIAAWARAAVGKIKVLNTINNGPRDRRIGFTIAVLLWSCAQGRPCPAVNELVSRRALWMRVAEEVQPAAMKGT